MVSRETLLGLHHVTALAGDPQRNLDFYSQVPGIRLVKRTVNFDDPGSYHLYFGSAGGAPGSLITFFNWGRTGTPGPGQINNVAMRAGDGLDPCVSDPDRIPVTFLEGESPRLESVTLTEVDAHPTLKFLGEVLGLSAVGSDRFALPDGGSIIVQSAPGMPRGKMAAGIVHHVAFRAADEAAQLFWREKLIRAGLRVSHVKDRLYFHSIYFREPGGVLFEIATDGPGFAIDEPLDRLGERLCLPPWLEPARESIERRLPALRLPVGNG